ncbi:MAG: chaperone modulator CbpM [Gammaproteobacteria bacterium]
MNEEILTGLLLEEQLELTLGDLCNACSQHAEWVIQLVDEGVLEPVGVEQRQWKFSAISLQRAQRAMHLQRDLGVNLAGVALALDLLDEIYTLRTRLGRFEVD